MEQRINYLLRAMLLLMVLLPTAFSVKAQNSYWVNGIRYEVTGTSEYYWGTTDDVTLTVVAPTGDATYSGDIVIPEIVKVNVARYDGSYYGGNYELVCRVEHIGADAFRDCTGLTSITLPKTLKTIEQNAFYGCTGLTSLTIPNGVGSIFESAFAYCTGLTSITIPNSVTYMGWNVFYSCTGLTNVTLSQSLDELQGTFRDCTGLTSVTIPASVTRLEGTFNGCTSLTSVHLPKSVTRIGENSFAGCSSLTSIYIPNTVFTIGQKAFAGTALTTLELPSAVENIHQNAFEGCSHLTSVTSRNLTPPSMLNSDIFDGETYGTAALYVPAVSATQYCNADWWKLFENVEGKSALDNNYDFEVGGIYYLITGPNTVSVTYRDTNYNSYSGSVTIPSSVTNGGVTYSVTAIGRRAFYDCSGLTAVSMPATVTTIGLQAFLGCTGLSGVAIPQAVTTISGQAFFNCSGLTALTIPENVATIGSSAFTGTSGLTTLVWNARECLTNGYMNTEGITSLTIGDEVRVIPTYLAYNSRITSLDIPLSVTTISGGAFQSCTGLTTLTIPLNVEYIGTSAFSSCTGLTSLVWNARECWGNGDMTTTGITSLTIGDQVKILPLGLAKSSLITSLNIPSSVTIIGGNAFYGCNGLTSVVIPDNVTDIGYQAFCNCSSLTELTLGKSVESIDAYGFWGCPITTLTWNARNLTVVSTGGYDQYEYYHPMLVPNVMDYSYLTQLTIGDEVESLPYYFAYQSKITSVNLPASLTEIGAKAFSGCSNLTAIDLPAALTTIGSEAFINCNGIVDLFIPSSLTSFGTRAFNNCMALETIVVDVANPVYDSRDNSNAMFKTANDSIVLVCKNSTLPNSITVIPDSAFYGQTVLTNLVIPPTVTSIGKDAFNGCTRLTNITIPASVTHIGERAFAYCTSLNTIVVENGNPVYDSRDNCNAIIETASNTLTEGGTGTLIPATVATIGTYSFLGRSPGTVTIPDGVETIADSAFLKSFVYELRIGNTVKTIGNHAFDSCSSLQVLSLGISVETIGDYAFSKCFERPDMVTGFGKDENGYYYYRINYEEWDDYSNTEYIYLSYNEETGLYYYFDPWTGAEEWLTSEEIEAMIVLDQQPQVLIPASVETIGDFAFNYCSNLRSVVIESGSLISIGYHAFLKCRSLESITIPPSLQSIDYDAFGECNSLSAVKISDLEAWCNIDFNMYSSNPLYYARHLYLNGEEVVDLVIPDGVTALKREVFSRCLGLRSVTIPETVTSIGYEAFEQCDSLKSVTISNSVETIGNYAFGYCQSLTTVTLGSGLKSIGNYGFYYCRAITSLTSLATTPPTLGYYPFSCYNTATLRVPERSLAAYKTATYWKNFKTIEGIPGAGPGDINGDGELNISDINLLINALLNGDSAIEDNPNADLNGDGTVNLSDITMLINNLLNAH